LLLDGVQHPARLGVRDGFDLVGVEEMDGLVVDEWAAIGCDVRVILSQVVPPGDVERAERNRSGAGH